MQHQLQYELQLKLFEAIFNNTGAKKYLIVQKDEASFRVIENSLTNTEQEERHISCPCWIILSRDFKKSVVLSVSYSSLKWPLVKRGITELQNSGAEFCTCFLTHEKIFTAVIIHYKLQGAAMYGTTSVRWIVHTFNT